MEHWCQPCRSKILFSDWSDGTLLWLVTDMELSLPYLIQLSHLIVNFNDLLCSQTAVLHKLNIIYLFKKKLGRFKAKDWIWNGKVFSVQPSLQNNIHSFSVSLHTTWNKKDQGSILVALSMDIEVFWRDVWCCCCCKGFIQSLLSLSGCKETNTPGLSPGGFLL